MSCEKVTLLVEKSKENSLSFKELFHLKTHLAMCPPCSKYSKLSKQLDGLFSGVVNIEDPSISLSELKKQEILMLVQGFDS
jgi:hypothetical protein